MSDPISLIEAWLTYVNVQVLGLKPAHVNLVKTTTLLLGSGLVLWVAISKSSERPVGLVLERLRGCSARKIIAAAGVLLTVVVSYLSLRQFYMYTAASYDLAIYANTLWHVVHGQWFFVSLLNVNMLGDHFVPVLAIFAPVYALWESPVWLLLGQAIALGAGAVAMGLLAHRLTGSPIVVLVALLLYVFNPYLHIVAEADFHAIALAIPVFLWLFYFLDTGRYWLAAALALLALFIEESQPPAVVGVGLYLLCFRPKLRWMGAALVVGGVLCFIVQVTVLMPQLSGEGLLHWYRYSNLGPDFKTAVYNLATGPFFLIHEALIKDHKAYYLLALLYSVGFLPLLAWREASLLILPVLLMLLSQDGGLYKFGHHYSAGVLPFLFYSTTCGLVTLKRMLLRRDLIILRSDRVLVVLFLVLLVNNIYLVKWPRLGRIDATHAAAINRVLAEVTPSASVRVEGNMLAMLSGRHRIAPLVVSIEDNFGWWRPDCVVFDFKMVENDPHLLSARKVMLNYLTVAPEYRLLDEQDGVVLFALAEPSPSGPGGTLTQP